MNQIIIAINRHAKHTPDAIAIENQQYSLTYPELSKAIAIFANDLQAHQLQTIALLADNSPAWCVADLACLQAGITLIPVPHFFSPTQTSHLLRSASVDAVLSASYQPTVNLLTSIQVKHHVPIDISIAQQTLSLIPIDISDIIHLPDACTKITFTSGSTGEPKGVCLSSEVMQTVSTSLAHVTQACSNDRHLSLLPYATLLENIGGIYVPLLSGATIIASSLSEVGLSGSSGLDVQRFVGALLQSRATTCIMIPQMLHALIAALETGAPMPQTLRFIAVGGAPVSQQLLQRAAALKLPVFEGYGLSEASSVVAVNSPSANKQGSVGKLLPHAEVICANDGEILVKGGLFSGYLGDDPFHDTYWPTGDIGYVDDEGFLFLNGRKKHIFITAFGRNVSPEWVEGELSLEPAIAQCCVFGEARPFNVAIIVGRNDADKQSIQQAIDAANAHLPDYATISTWILAHEPFSVANGLWTGTGRPRRTFIFKQYEKNIIDLYQNKEI